MNNRKRQRSEANNSNTTTSINNHSNCVRIVCLLALTQVVLSAYQHPSVYKTVKHTLYGSSSSSLQFATFGAAGHSSPLLTTNSNSALHISFAETFNSASASASQPNNRSSQHEADDQYSMMMLPEWTRLSKAVQQELKQILSYQQVSTFDYPALFRLDELTQGHSLLFMSWAILGQGKSLNLLSQLNLSPTKFFQLVRAIEQGYQETNPYHNRIHAADVLQTLHSLLTSQGLSLNKTQHLSILLAAILHDVGHDGTNNLLHVQTQSKLAIQFQNVSVLEQYHVQVGLEELKTSGLLEDLPTFQQQEIQDSIQEAILHTDMAKHHSQVEAYQQGNLDTWQQAIYLLHLSDISNPTKVSTMLEWTDFVLEEFYQIGDEQKALGLPVSFDRNTADKVSIQRGFMKYMVVPAFEAVQFENPNIMKGLYANLEYWLNQEPKKESS